MSAIFKYCGSHEEVGRPNKALGQHFLKNSGIIQKILNRSRFGPTDTVLEVGPGKGALTVPLARRVAHVIAVEKDRALVALLEEKISSLGISNVTLVQGDILTWDFHGVGDLGKIQVMGNLPYNISTPFLERLIEHRRLVSRAVLMFQAEVAHRLTASPGGKTYGALTVFTQYHAATTILLHASRDSFYPRPQVDSIVVELDFDRPYPLRASDESALVAVVKGAFAHRRKTLLNSLRGHFPALSKEQFLEGMANCGVDPGRRAETLGVDDFLCLSRALELTRRPSDDSLI